MAKRSTFVLAAAAVVTAAIAAYIFLYLTNVPSAVSAAQTSAGAQLYLATVPAAEPTDPHPTWVSYYVTNSHAADWKHDTTFVVRAHELVHVTVFQYDSASGLRNNFISQARGTVGGTFTLNGTPMASINPADAAHVFSIPALNVSVPLYGVPDTAKNTCSQAPCTMSQTHETVSFTFQAGAKGLYRWQCFVPCGAGYVDGNGGPMQTVGYMEGYVKVV